MNAPRFNRVRSVRFASVVALAALSLLTPAMAAQDGDEAHPAHIHSGSCAELGDVVAPLNDVALPEGEQTGPETGHAVKISENNLIDMPLQEIIDGGHAINVHESADAIDVYIACGDIGGILHALENGEAEDQELVIGLAELNGSGHVGTAWLGAFGDQTRVTVSLIEPEGMGTAGAESAQEASPAAGAAAESTAVEIKDFAFNPPTTEVPIGGSVTWTNGDNVPHTATGLDREALQSGAIEFDASFTQTFDTAGTYEYFCEFHPNMKGSIVVE